MDATEQDWFEEYLAPIISIRVVAGVQEAIDHINTNQLSKKEIKIYLEQFTVPEPLGLFKETIPYSLNISANNALEAENFKLVFVQQMGEWVGVVAQKRD